MNLTRSHCHAWSAAPTYFLSAYILGVRCNSVGFKNILIDPYPCGLTFVKGSVPLPCGRVDLKWEIKDEIMHIEVKAPEEYALTYQINKEKCKVKKVYINGEIFLG